MDTKLCLMLVVAFLLGYYLRPVCSNLVEGLTCGARFLRPPTIDCGEKSRREGGRCPPQPTQEDYLRDGATLPTCPPCNPGFIEQDNSIYRHGHHQSSLASSCVCPSGHTVQISRSRHGEYETCVPDNTTG